MYIPFCTLEKFWEYVFFVAEVYYQCSVHRPCDHQPREEEKPKCYCIAELVHSPFFFLELILDKMQIKYLFDSLYLKCLRSSRVKFVCG